MTNREAARIAMECILAEAARIAPGIRYNDKSPEMDEKRRRYARLTAALKYYEGLLAQKGLGI
jgi:hypothetical protein